MISSRTRGTSAFSIFPDPGRRLQLDLQGLDLRAHLGDRGLGLLDVFLDRLEVVALGADRVGAGVLLLLLQLEPLLDFVEDADLLAELIDRHLVLAQ